MPIELCRDVPPWRSTKWMSGIAYIVDEENLKKKEKMQQPMRL